MVLKVKFVLKSVKQNCFEKLIEKSYNATDKSTAYLYITRITTVEKHHICGGGKTCIFHFIHSLG